MEYDSETGVLDGREDISSKYVTILTVEEYTKVSRGQRASKERKDSVEHATLCTCCILRGDNLPYILMSCIQ